MAEKIVNNGIVFAYASNDAFFEIKTELEKYFLYQTVLVIDQNYEYGDVIDKLKENVNCNFVVKHNIESDYFKDVDFVIAINDLDMCQIKQICFEEKIPYMIVLTKVVSYAVCCNKIIDAKNRQIQVNKPFGIVLDKSKIYDKKAFLCKSVIEISTAKFDIIQKQIANMFYNKKIDYDLIRDEQKAVFDMYEIFNNEYYDLNKIFHLICDEYVTYCIKRSKDDIDLLDKISCLFLKFNKDVHNKHIEIKFLYSQVISVLQSRFFSTYQTGLKETINYGVHQKKLSIYNQKSNFVVVKLFDSKLNFLLEQFKSKFNGYVKEQAQTNEKLKDIISDIDIDYYFSLFSNVDREKFVDMLSLEPSIFSETNILSIMYSQGLLNYSL